MRCWKYGWIVDLDVQKFFDTVPWDLVVKAVERVTDARWVLLYVKRWLAAPLQRPDGTLEERDKGNSAGIGDDCSHAIANFEFERSVARAARRNRP